jgi:hypothetical protein
MSQINYENSEQTSFTVSPTREEVLDYLQNMSSSFFIASLASIQEGTIVEPRPGIVLVMGSDGCFHTVIDSEPSATGFLSAPNNLLVE